MHTYIQCMKDCIPLFEIIKVGRNRRQVKKGGKLGDVEEDESESEGEEEIATQKAALQRDGENAGKGNLAVKTNFSLRLGRKVTSIRETLASLATDGMHACMYVCLYVCVCIYVCMCVCMYVCMYVCVCV